PGKQGLVYLLRADEMHVHVDAAGCDDLPFAGDDLGAWADDDRDVLLDIGISGLANRRDPSAPDADVGLHDSPVIDDQRIRDHGVDRAVGSSALRLPHAVANDLPAAEFHFLTVRREVSLDLDDEVGIGETNPVADGRAEHLRIRWPTHRVWHGGATPVRLPSPAGGTRTRAARRGTRRAGPRATDRARTARRFPQGYRGDIRAPPADRTPAPRSSRRNESD